MLELSDHILDISENSVRAGAKLIEIFIEEDTKSDLLKIVINDDGSGIKKEDMEKALDPFYTTKEVRRIGLGLPFFSEAAKMSGGKMQLESEESKGTRITATFRLDNIDRQPMGNIVNTLMTLIAGNSGIDFYYKHRCDDKVFEMDTRCIRYELDDVSIIHPEILKYIRNVLREGIESINSKA